MHTSLIPVLSSGDRNIVGASLLSKQMPICEFHQKTCPQTEVLVNRERYSLMTVYITEHIFKVGSHLIFYKVQYSEKNENEEKPVLYFNHMFLTFGRGISYGLGL